MKQDVSLTCTSGSEAAGYDKIGYGKGEATSSGVRIESEVSITAGKFVNLGAKVIRGIKDTPEHLITEDYVRNMHEATQWKVILSDKPTRQNWLADGASVILHLFRAWLHIFKGPTFPLLEGIASKIILPPSTPGPLASFETLTSDRNRSLPLHHRNHKVESKPTTADRQARQQDAEITVTTNWFLFEDKAQSFYHALELIHDRMIRIRHCSGIELTRQGTKNIGFEFRDLAECKTNLEPRTIELGEGAAAWLPYAQSANAIHLHGSKLGVLLRPARAQNQQLGCCSQEQAAPQLRGFLMAPLSVLREGIERHQHSESCIQLADGVFWRDIHDCFGIYHCSRSDLDREVCKQLVRKLDTKAPSNFKHQITAEDVPGIFSKIPAGAIIVGYDPQKLMRIPPRGPRAGQVHQLPDVERSVDMSSGRSYDRGPASYLGRRFLGESNIPTGPRDGAPSSRPAKRKRQDGSPRRDHTRLP